MELTEFTCTLCGLAFDTQELLDKHISDRHPKAGSQKINEDFKTVDEEIEEEK